ncbi:hypothetical protein Neosp_003213 [[Neocosmospora] mangrovei]
MAVKKVGMHKWRSGSGNDQLETRALATCIRIAIVGVYPAHDQAPGSPDRFLAHIKETDERPAILVQLIRKVQAAVAAGLTDLKATVVLCHPDSVVTNNSGPVTPEQAEKNQLSIEEQEAHNDVVMDDMYSMVARENVVIQKHHCDEFWKLVIKGDKQFEYGPQ